MKNIKIVYEYDGFNFFGFQRQNDKKTIQGTIEDILKKSFNENVNLISSGRTDKGVHAKMQVSNFFMNKDIPLEIIKNKINKYSNDEIRVYNISEVNLEYNSRYDNNIRTYEYILVNKKYYSIFERNYVSKIDYTIDINKLNDILKEFIGENDFSFFSKFDKKSNKNPMRKIYEFYSVEKGNKIYIYVKGNSFLKTMVRIMVGTALAIYEGKINKGYIKDKFSNPNQNLKKYIASSSGLYLYKVE